MRCSNCGAEVYQGQTHCPNCGSELVWNSHQANHYPTGYYTGSEHIPPQYRPLGAWAYFGYSLLFAIPIVGFILLIVFSFSNENINRRNFARSFWCGLLVATIILFIAAATGAFRPSAYY